MRKRISNIILFILFSLVCCSCSSIEEYIRQADPEISREDDVKAVATVDEGPVSGGILRLYANDSSNFHPLYLTDSYMEKYIGLIFESLVFIDCCQKPHGLLAESWSISNDGLSWTFKLRNDVLWHDGTPFTAKDVVFTVNSLLSSSNASRAHLENILSCTAAGNYYVKFRLKKPNYFTAETMIFPIIPEHVYKDEKRASQVYSMIGTGPYSVSRFEENALYLKKNNNWWRAGITKAPNIEQVCIKFYEGKNIMEAYVNNEVDIAVNINLSFTDYSKRDDSVFATYTGNHFEFLAFNTKSEFFSDANIRKAVASSIDKNEIFRNIINMNYIVESEIPLLPGSWVYPEDVFFMGYKPSFSLDELISDQDRQNKKIEISLLVNIENGRRINICKQIQDQLQKHGINVNIVALNFQEYLEKVIGGEFDMAIMGLDINNIPDLSYLYGNSYFPGGDNQDVKGRAVNVSGYDNPALQSTIDNIFSSKTESEVMNSIKRAAEIIVEELPYTGLYFEKQAVIYSKRIRGSFNPYNWNIFEGFEEWYILDREA